VADIVYAKNSQQHVTIIQHKSVFSTDFWSSSGLWCTLEQVVILTASDSRQFSLPHQGEMWCS